VRIIAGDKGGFPILPPKGQTTRPMPDRVKAALFSILGGRLPAVGTADFFAGTGSFGLEALSRGASHCWFYERDREASDRLRTNLRTTGLAERGSVVGGDLFRAPFPPRNAGPGSLGIVSLDPPYPFLEAGSRLREPFRQLLIRLAGSGWPAADAVWVIRRERRMTLPLEDVPLAAYDERTYGGMTLTFLTRPGAVPIIRPAAAEFEGDGDADDEPAGEE
jgi:16S rRNA (guanine966-N2)-methyltransferase